MCACTILSAQSAVARLANALTLRSEGCRDPVPVVAFWHAGERADPCYRERSANRPVHGEYLGERQEERAVWIPQASARGKPSVQSIGLSSNGLHNDARCPAPRLASASSGSGPAVWQLLSEAQANGKIKPHRRAADVADKFSDLYLNAFAAHEPRPHRRTSETRGRERSASISSGGPSSQPEGASDPDSDGGPSSLRRMRYSDSDSAASTWSGPDLGTTIN